MITQFSGAMKSVAPVSPYDIKWWVHWYRSEQRARTVCTKPELLNKEIQHLRKALTKCKYPKWALDKVERKFTNSSQENSNTQPREEDSNNPSGNTTGRDPTKDKYNKGHIVIPYTQGLGESIKKICSKYGIQTHFKGNKTIKEILVKSKDKDPLDRRSEAIYWYQCGELACNEEYIGETSRNFGEVTSTWRNPHPFMGMAASQDTAPTQITLPL